MSAEVRPSKRLILSLSGIGLFALGGFGLADAITDIIERDDQVDAIASEPSDSEMEFAHEVSTRLLEEGEISIEDLNRTVGVFGQDALFDNLRDVNYDPLNQIQSVGSAAAILAGAATYLYSTLKE
ncbi:hypothetical protein HYT32_00130 [Candidatus Roizmanbacteria bacterium]|nr:hypothetical protein [Candidatus Roizmanbacteria bacterium]